MLDEADVMIATQGHQDQSIRIQRYGMVPQGRGAAVGTLSSPVNQQDWSDGLALVQGVHKGTMSGDDKQFHFLTE